MDYPNKANEKALLQAARKGDLDECKRLVLELQTDVNAREDENEIGWSPLLLASRGGNAELVTFLVRHGADINYLSKSHQSALHAACWNGHEDIVVLLLSYGADVNVQNSFGQTPLHWACHYGYISIVKLLLRNKADVTIRNDMGNTPLDKAISMRRSACARILQKHQETDPDDLLICVSESQRSTSWDCKTESRQRCSDFSNASVEVCNSLITAVDGEPVHHQSDESKHSSHESSNPIFENSETEVSPIEVDISFIEIPLEKDPEEQQYGEVCSETEYEDDETTRSAWSKVPRWFRKIDWKKVWIVFWICFLLGMLIFMAVGVAKIRRNGSANEMVRAPTPPENGLLTLAPVPTSTRTSVPTQSPVNIKGTSSPSLSVFPEPPLVLNAPWFSRNTRPPSTGNQDEHAAAFPTMSPSKLPFPATIVAVSSPSAPPAVSSTVVGSTQSPVYSRPTNTPTAAPSQLQTQRAMTTLPSAQPTDKPTIVPTTIAPTKAPVSATTRAPFALWG